MNERQLAPSPTTADAAAPAPAAEAPAAAGFSNAGPLPPVANTGPEAAPAPSASDQAFGQYQGLFGKIGQDIEHGAQEAEVVAAEGVGVAELAGFKYPVKSYEAQVDGGLFRGSRVDQAGMQALKQQGIVGIVNLCMENNNDAAPAKQLGLQALHIPILDNSAPTIAQMQQFIAFARANPPTYVHCEAGKGRTGTAVACYRIAVDGWTAEQAIAEGKSFGLSLINQIEFIQHFAAVTKGGPAAGPMADGEKAKTDDKAAKDDDATQEPTAV